jgi:hypothetical protein
VHRSWRVFGLQPHRIESFKPSTHPDFVAKVRNVVGLYMSPPERAIVLCVDEKSQIQALDRSQPMLPMRPGQPGCWSHDYHLAVRRAPNRHRSRHRQMVRRPSRPRVRIFLDAIEAAVPRRRPSRHGQLRHHKTLSACRSSSSARSVSGSRLCTGPTTLVMPVT